MRPRIDPPAGLLLVPFGKGCVLLLTPQEITAGIRRGKWWRLVGAVPGLVGLWVMRSENV